ncbi:hypothetical protein SCG7086_AP_00180 [Chlamydiales bacterium SCGC AG-110-P3]|nr:hypothetical protein SCG7086_AP_00180 [Chlamydiales bacterium SCGC AG-110-P3]
MHCTPTPTPFPPNRVPPFDFTGSNPDPDPLLLLPARIFQTATNSTSRLTEECNSRAHTVSDRARQQSSTNGVRSKARRIAVRPGAVNSIPRSTDSVAAIVNGVKKMNLESQAPAQPRTQKPVSNHQKKAASLVTGSQRHLPAPTGRQVDSKLLTGSVTQAPKKGYTATNSTSTHTKTSNKPLSPEIHIELKSCLQRLHNISTKLKEPVLDEHLDFLTFDTLNQYSKLVTFANHSETDQTSAKIIQTLVSRPVCQLFNKVVAEVTQNNSRIPSERTQLTYMISWITKDFAHLLNLNASAIAKGQAHLDASKCDTIITQADFDEFRRDGLPEGSAPNQAVVADIRNILAEHGWEATFHSLTGQMQQLNNRYQRIPNLVAQKNYAEATETVYFGDAPIVRILSYLASIDELVKVAKRDRVFQHHHLSVLGEYRKRTTQQLNSVGCYLPLIYNGCKQTLGSQHQTTKKLIHSIARLASALTEAGPCGVPFMEPSTTLNLLEFLGKNVRELAGKTEGNASHNPLF